jgi:hypothetical protein
MRKWICFEPKKKGRGKHLCMTRKISTIKQRLRAETSNPTCSLPFLKARTEIGEMQGLRRTERSLDLREQSAADRLSQHANKGVSRKNKKHSD